MIASTPSSVLDTLPRFMTNVTDAELDTIRSLVATWRAKQPRNLLRSVYYDGKMPLKPTGNIPAEAFRRIKAVLGWPEKAVGGLADRTVFDGFVSPGQQQDPFGLSEMLDLNRFDLDLPQAIVSAFKHSCSFITIARGDTQGGEPPVLIMPRSAEWSAGLWDKRRRAVKGALAVTAVDDGGNPKAMDVYLPGLVLLCTRRPSGSWVAERRDAKLQEVLVEPLAYDPQLDRPFGRSRISRAVMSITDHALTTIVRTEIGGDFYAVPRMAAIGVAEDAFKRGKWQAAIDRMLAITRDEEGELPSLHQFAQMTMQPLMDQYRMYASQFSGETGLPVSSLGIVQDNPPSAEALYAAEKDLIVKARATTKVLGGSLRQVARKVVMVRDGLTEAPAELRGIQTNWLNPAFTSPVTAADALVKLSTVFPWLGDTEDALRYAGFTEAEVTRLLSDKRRAQGGSTLARALAARSAATDTTAAPGDDAA
ncbi:phage portal protein [Cellulomonas hominis]|uniref:phage portal protein n=1 Tax=Cellulomonas hominis TaxID=156981 RepID=UPI0014440DCE|nr:phage portal protein [Cellulomonas hominis]NKY08935.1 phage portal protein [Cellulomonas hominis]